jgi:hypothetical protein
MKLSDGEIRQIFESVDQADANASQFVKAFARCVRLAPRADFLLMRPIAVVMIGRHNLGRYCESQPMEAQRSRCTLCGDSGFRPVESGDSGFRPVESGDSGDRRVTRCECRMPKVVKPAAAASHAATTDYKSAAAGDR